MHLSPAQGCPTSTMVSIPARSLPAGIADLTFSNATLPQTQPVRSIEQTVPCEFLAMQFKVRRPTIGAAAWPNSAMHSNDWRHQSDRILTPQADNAVDPGMAKQSVYDGTA